MMSQKRARLRRDDAASARRWNVEREREARQPLSIGIALNYGPAVLGNVGSEHSMWFTVIGDTVNTADRLQTLTRGLRTPLIIGDPLIKAINSFSPEKAEEVGNRLQDQEEHVLRGTRGRRPHLDAQDEPIEQGELI
jgi:adenylate cyclase